MAFLRFTRDKRGYEHFYLVEPITNRRGKARTRVLYWYRTPPNVRVGREPFDEAVRRALEAQNPGVQFDWRKIIETPIPSAEAERWRERRRADKAEKLARRDAMKDARPAESDEGDRDEAAFSKLSTTEDTEDAEDAEEMSAIGESETNDVSRTLDVSLPTEPGLSGQSRQTTAASEASGGGVPASVEKVVGVGAHDKRKKRRRRGRRGRHDRTAGAAVQPAPAANHEPAAPPPVSDAPLQEPEE